MANQMNIMGKIDDEILLLKKEQNELEDNTIIEEMAIQLISECRFEEATKLLKNIKTCKIQ